MDATARTAPKPFVFVLMPFDPAFDDVYLLGIKEAANAAGAHCERVDEQIFDETIMDRVYNQIAKADLIVAEMTGRNPNVFYETGYAHALGKRVVLLTQRAEDIPFDLKHFPHVVYGGRIAELRSEVERRVRWAVEHPAESLTSVEPLLEFFLKGRPLHGATLVTTWGQLAQGIDLNLAIHNVGKQTYREGMSRVALAVPAELEGVRAFQMKPQAVRLPDGKRLFFLNSIADIFPDAWEVLPTGLVGHAPSSSEKPAEYALHLRVYSEVTTREIPFTLRVE